MSKFPKQQPTATREEQPVVASSAFDGSVQRRDKRPRESIIADLNADPLEIDQDVAYSVPDSSVRNDGFNQLLTDTTKGSENMEIDDNVDTVKSIVMATARDSEIMEIDLDRHSHGVSTSSRDEKVSNLKAGLIHVARKMPKNAHSHFLLGLMYQRIGQPHKAVSSFEKSSEILRQSELEVKRPELLSLVQIHHAQCIVLASGCENTDNELGNDELQSIISKLKETVRYDIRQAAVWNTLGLMLLWSGRLQSAISVLSSLLVMAPDCLDCIANLGIAYLQSGKLELSAKCFQELILKDQKHPAALMNYAAFLLFKHGSIITGPGANFNDGTTPDQIKAVDLVKRCMIEATRSDSKSRTIWVNLSNAYSLAGENKNARKCLEQAAQLEPNNMSTRYAIALQRIKDAERSQDPGEQLTLAANEMVSILKDGDSSLIEIPIVWCGIAKALRSEHEISKSYGIPEKIQDGAKDFVLHTLKQAIAENPGDASKWHQLGLHALVTLQFESSQDFLKASIARNKEISYAWSNLGISLQLSGDSYSAEKVYKRALSLSTPQQAHAILSNLGNLYRQEKQFDHAKKMLRKSLEFCPQYAPSHNNLGLIFVAEGHWEEAKRCFQKAIELDPLLDAAESNMVKSANMINHLTQLEQKNT
ncbi:hypothetical protein ZOSMA_79G00200 [Zostera marina]|uniref:UDP-N-acetylglucosamine--peptide N-acetylglucosaminyltransferase SPINDLY n=1 Tax=Zostera marina TaxID=29655 RepID=A0A0K9NN37_ZOSMR|nr:hypothetical protein ZOSMA_79G00200 [Zostera marina]